MKIVKLDHPHNYQPKLTDQAVCAIGFFDGVHKGHQRVIKSAKDTAERLNKKLAVMTFSPHPLEVLKKGEVDVTYLTTFEQKKQIFKDLGVDILYLIQFNLTVSQLKAQFFIDHYIVDLNISQLVCGFDFTYGHRGAGNVHTLPDHSKERFEITVVKKYSEENKKISSTYIRELLKDGRVDLAKQLLTRSLMTDGTVVHGYKRGREIGYPTANIAVYPGQALPKIGIYYVKVVIDDKIHHGMASLGYNPTFHDESDQKVKLEINLLDFNECIYDEKLTIQWEKFIRLELKFDQVDQLIEQIRQDEVEIRRLIELNS